MKATVVYCVSNERAEKEIEISDVYRYLEEMWPPTATTVQYTVWKLLADYLDRDLIRFLPNGAEIVGVRDADTCDTLYFN